MAKGGRRGRESKTQQRGQGTAARVGGGVRAFGVFFFGGGGGGEGRGANGHVLCDCALIYY
jgi:hypothetical protein